MRTGFMAAVAALMLLAASGDVLAQVSGSNTSTVIANPTSALTRPANTTAYAQNNLIANNVTAGSVVVPSFATPSAVTIPKLLLSTNKTTGWDQVVIRVRLWSVAPTYTNGDGGAYAVATGAAQRLGQFDITLTQFGDGASGSGVPATGTADWLNIAPGTAIYWDMQYIGSTSLTPASGQTFALTPELVQ